MAELYLNKLHDILSAALLLATDFDRIYFDIVNERSSHPAALFANFENVYAIILL